ncbi:MAG: hypothetical protein QW622_01970 [Candidatus Pacearchaeota archaeon]
MTKKINVDYFDKPSANMYYVLGAFYGSAVCNNRELTFRSNYEDLVKIVKKELEIEHKIIPDTRGKNSYFLTIRSKKHILPLYSKLNEKGFAIEKQKRKFPKINEEYLNHFIRGFFDAKATVNPKVPYVKITFNNEFLNSLEAILKKNGINNILTCNNNLTCSNLEDILKIYDFIYKDVKGGDSLLYLKPKKEIYDKMEQIAEKEKEEAYKIKEMIDNRFEQTKNIREILLEVNTNIKKIFKSVFRTTLIKYLREKKAEEIKKIIDAEYQNPKTNFKIRTKIASKLYDNPLNLSRLFKKFYGESLRNYCKKVKADRVARMIREEYEKTNKIRGISSKLVKITEYDQKRLNKLFMDVYGLPLSKYIHKIASEKFLY